MPRSRPRTFSSASALALTLIALPAVTQCAPGPNGTSSPSASHSATVAASPSPSAAPTCAESTLDSDEPAPAGRPTPRLRRGRRQADAKQLRQVTDYHLGGVILTGGSSAGVTATAEVSENVRDRATDSAGVGPWISADQEGGYVQHLQGPGFSDMPTALTQGGWPAQKLTDRAENWGGQLKRAGINLDLAPILDTVPADLGRDNKPIGYYYREFGHTPAKAAEHGMAVADGLAAAGVQTSGKHFPGLGRVLGNTDTTDDVVDDVTTRHDPYLEPFQEAVDHHLPVIMVSTARYDKIDDEHLAAFSPTVMQDMLRGDLGFTGVIMSDDLGIAKAVQDIPAGTRAVRFLERGGTVVLTVDPGTLPAMYNAVLDRRRTRRPSATKVHDAALHVLRAKQDGGPADLRRRASTSTAGGRASRGVDVSGVRQHGRHGAPSRAAPNGAEPGGPAGQPVYSSESPQASTVTSSPTDSLPGPQHGELRAERDTAGGRTAIAGEGAQRFRPALTPVTWSTVVTAQRTASLA